MPKQSDPNSNKTTGGQSTVPIASIQPDLPPLPPDFQNVEPSTLVTPPVDQQSTSPTDTQPNANQQENSTTSSIAQSELPPIISSNSKRKFGTKRIIATILGIFVLVGGVGAGIVTIQQPLFFQELAAGKKSWRDIGNPRAGRHAGKLAFEEAQRRVGDAPPNTQQNSGPPGTLDVTSFGYGKDVPPPAGTYYVYDESTGAIDGLRAIDAPGVFVGILENAQPDNIYDHLLKDVYHMDQADIDYGKNENLDGGLTWVPPGVGGVPYWHWTACLEGGVQGAGCGAEVEATDESDDEETITETASCQNIRAYSSTWTLLTNAELSALAPNTVVNFCVAGASSAGIFDKAQFKIGTVLEAETTTPRPGSTNEFCQSYTTKPTDATINVKAKINHTTLGWQGESI